MEDETKKNPLAEFLPKLPDGMMPVPIRLTSKFWEKWKKNPRGMRTIDGIFTPPPKGWPTFNPDALGELQTNDGPFDSPEMERLKIKFEMARILKEIDAMEKEE